MQVAAIVCARGADFGRAAARSAHAIRTAGHQRRVDSTGRGMKAINAAMPNVAYTPVVAADGTPLPHAVHLPDLSFRALSDRLGPALEACRAAARAVAGDDGWSA